METEMTPHLSAARRIAMDKIADAPIGAVARMLRTMDPDSDWPDGEHDMRQHCMAIADEGIMGDGPEACAVLATVLCETVGNARHDAIAADADAGASGGPLLVAIDWVAAGLMGGALTPEQSVGYVMGSR